MRKNQVEINFEILRVTKHFEAKKIRGKKNFFSKVLKLKKAKMKNS